MADLKMKINNTNDLRLKMKSNEIITMKFDDYQKFKEEDPIFKDSPAYKITNADINNWNHKSNFSGSYNDLRDKPNLSIYATKSELNSGLSNKVDKQEGMGLSQNSFTTDEKNKLASLENYDDSEIVAELATKANISSVPTKTSDLTNDSGFITKDVDDLTYYPTNDSVNSIVSLKQNLITSDNMVSSDLIDDTNATNKFVTASDITAWNNKSDFSGDYNDLTNKPTIPTLTSQLTNDSGFITNANIPSKTSDLQNDSGFITNTVNDLTNYTLTSALSTVATSGSYADLSNKPSIPTKISELTNDSNFATTSYVDDKVKDVFSKTETEIGTFDGAKLYRKILEYSSAMSSGTNIAHGVSNINLIIRYSGYIIAAGSKKPLPVIYPAALNTYGVSLYDYDTTNLHMVLGTWAVSNCTKIVIVIDYTKTS